MANSHRIERLGGVARASKAAFAAPGRDTMLMLQFDRIGDKYARNIWIAISAGNDRAPSIW
jgi:hypothetical protein